MKGFWIQGHLVQWTCKNKMSSHLWVRFGYFMHRHFMEMWFINAILISVPITSKYEGKMESYSSVVKSECW